MFDLVPDPDNAGVGEIFIFYPSRCNLGGFYFMKFKEFLKNNISYLIALMMNLAIVGFLFAPLLTYETKYYVGEEKIKDYFSANIIKLLSGSITPSWVFIVLLVFVIIPFFALIVALFLKNNKKVNDSLIAIVLIDLALLVAYAILVKEIFSYFAGEMGMIANFNGAQVGWGAGVIIFLAAVEFFAVISSSSYSKQSVQGLAEDAMLIAAAFILNFIKIPLGATGGSINFQMLPLMLIALRRGPVTGFICGGFIYGLITCLADGYGFATYPFDYLIAFGSVAVMGFFSKFILPSEEGKYPLWLSEIFVFVAGLLSTFVRFIGGTTSSMVIYGYQFVPALAYNALYIPLSGAAAVVVLMIVLPVLQKLNRKYPTK